VYINFTPTEETRLGMTVIVSKPEVADAADAQTSETEGSGTTQAATAEPAVTDGAEAAE
jgi:hypothetical protein